VKSETSCTQSLIDHAEEHGTSVLSLEQVPWEKVPAYGVADMPEDADTSSSFVVNDFVEKPSADEAPSNFAITGRYVFTNEIFKARENAEPGVGGELQLTDAIRKLDDVRGVLLEGDRYDIGNIPDWLRANIDMALHHDDGEMNAAVRELLRD
jgi:UTP--glucose-1-phosphate uridylyltransferase